MRPKDLLFLEYRTEKDELRPKNTPKHFRNYLDPDFVKKWCDHYGMTLDFQAEALGFAKLKKDNALVCRQTFIKV